MLKKFLRFNFYILLIFPLFVEANTFIVADTGKARSVQRYIENGDKIPQEKPFTLGDVQAALSAEFPMKATIPIKKISPYKVDVGLPYNIAVVGTDELSKEWLQLKITDIKAASAVVIVIDAKSLNEYTAFENVLRRAGLSVGKVDSKIFDAFLSGYPALIVNGVVSQ